MKDLLLSYASYNRWANKLLLDLISTLPEEKQEQPIISSFESIRKTLLHMADAESIWWQRLKLQEHILRPSENFSGNQADLSSLLQQLDVQWHQWVTSASGPMLQHEFIYRNSKKESFKQPVYQMLMHLFNHSTYHRGQLVTMLRQVGVTRIPITDYIEFARKKQG